MNDVKVQLKAGDIIEAQSYCSTTKTYEFIVCMVLEELKLEHPEFTSKGKISGLVRQYWKCDCRGKIVYVQRTCGLVEQLNEYYEVNDMHVRCLMNDEKKFQKECEAMVHSLL
jgi:hypothetical protein